MMMGHEILTNLLNFRHNRYFYYFENVVQFCSSKYNNGYLKLTSIPKRAKDVSQITGPGISFLSLYFAVCRVTSPH
jgi:hypothetical protein